MLSKEEKKCVALVWSHYKKNGRHRLPWRKTRNPYRILVSEIMLQQTQVDRVTGKYKSFLNRFPSVEALAKAPLGAVLTEWQGLGYNRRAKMLWEAARMILEEHKGKFPRSFETLRSLRGVGPYTAGAVMAFAYNKPVPIIETNIRTVIIHHFFGDEVDVPDTKVLAYAERLLDRSNPREWYYALMDYGSYLKKAHGNPNVRSAHYTKQSTFKGSDREIRGAILRSLSLKKSSREGLRILLPFDEQRIDEQLEALLKEEMVCKKGRMYLLP